MDTGFASNNLEQILQTKWKNMMMEWDPVDDGEGKETDFMPKDYWSNMFENTDKVLYNALQFSLFVPFKKVVTE